MKFKDLKLKYRVAIRIVIVCITGMIMSIINSNLHSFFGDKYIGNNSFQFIHDGYDWSTTHWWFFIMCVSLFLLNLFNLLYTTIQEADSEF